MKCQLKCDKVVKINNHKFKKTHIEEIKINDRSIYRTRWIQSFSIHSTTVGTKKKLEN